MVNLRELIKVLVRRPFLIHFLGLVTLLYSLIDYINPVYPILFNSLGAVQGEAAETINLLDGYILLIKLIFTPEAIEFGLLYVVSASIAAAVFAGFILSGYLYVLNITLDGYEKEKAEFLVGVKNYFKRLTRISFIVIILSIVFLLFLFITSLPSIVMTKSLLLGKSEFLVPAVLLDLLTVFVLFFGMMFFRIYIYFWYASALNSQTNFFRTGKKIADSCFWRLIGGMLIYDLIFVLVQGGVLYLRYLHYNGRAFIGLEYVFLFTGNWLFLTLFTASLITYIFTSFRRAMQNKQGL